MPRVSKLIDGSNAYLLGLAKAEGIDIRRG
jgi:hypothetical protein